MNPLKNWTYQGETASNEEQAELLLERVLTEADELVAVSKHAEAVSYLFIMLVSRPASMSSS